MEPDEQPFPAWLARRDPIVAGAGENGVYQAFARRRLGRAARTAMGRFLLRAEGTFSVLRWVVLAAAMLMALDYPRVVRFVVAETGIPQPLATMMLYFTFTIPLIWGLIPLSGSNHFEARRVFRKAYSDPRMSMDFYMGGVRGGDILAAIYLEDYRVMLRKIAPLPVVLGFGLMLMLVRILDLGLGESVFLGAIILLLVAETSLAIPDCLGNLLAEQSLKPRIRFWRSRSITRHFSNIVRDLIRGTLMMGLVLLALVGVVAFVEFLNWLRRPPAAYGWLVDYLHAKRFYFLWLAIVLLLLATTAFLRRWERRRSARRIPELLAEGTAAFDGYIRRTLEGDPDWERQPNDPPPPIPQTGKTQDAAAAVLAKREQR